jgi:hypothetical protein
MQLTTFTTVLFVAAAIAGPIAMPEKVAAFNVKVRNAARLVPSI